MARLIAAALLALALCSCDEVPTSLRCQTEAGVLVECVCADDAGIGHLACGPDGSSPD